MIDKEKQKLKKAKGADAEGGGDLPNAGKVSMSDTLHPANHHR